MTQYRRANSYKYQDDLATAKEGKSKPPSLLAARYTYFSFPSSKQRPEMIARGITEVVQTHRLSWHQTPQGIQPIHAEKFSWDLQWWLTCLGMARDDDEQASGVVTHNNKRSTSILRKMKTSRLCLIFEISRHHRPVPIMGGKVPYETVVHLAATFVAGRYVGRHAGRLESE